MHLSVLQTLSIFTFKCFVILSIGKEQRRRANDHIWSMVQSHMLYDRYVIKQRGASLMVLASSVALPLQQLVYRLLHIAETPTVFADEYCIVICGRWCVCLYWSQHWAGMELLMSNHSSHDRMKQ